MNEMNPDKIINQAKTQISPEVIKMELRNQVASLQAELARHTNGWGLRIDTTLNTTGPQAEDAETQILRMEVARLQEAIAWAKEHPGQKPEARLIDAFTKTTINRSR